MLFCYLCFKARDNFNVLCQVCIDILDNLAEGLEEEEEEEKDCGVEKYNIEEYDIFYFQRKRGYTI